MLNFGGEASLIVAISKTKEMRYTTKMNLCLWVLEPIQINQPTGCNNFTSLLLDVYVWLNMFRVPLRPSSGGTTALGASGFTYCHCCTLLMMGGEAPETCWATHKRQVINLWNCCILLVDLFESYDDARTCERQMLEPSLYDVQRRTVIERFIYNYRLRGRNNEHLLEYV